ncbi:MAG: hypothetical protein FJW40_08800 [Acidobacteria bacterium]|nr:hypothetical protein [Acidobacteriota bacterium]
MFWCSLRAAALLALCAGVLSAGNVLKYARKGPRVVFQLDDGEAVIDWISGASVEISRARRGGAVAEETLPRVAVKYFDIDRTSSVLLRSDDLVLTIHKQPFRVEVRDSEQRTLLSELGMVWGAGGKVRMEFAAPRDEQWMGLGYRRDQRLAANGMMIETRHPAVLSTWKYFLRFLNPGLYRFDVGKADDTRRSVSFDAAERFSYRFHLGGNLKGALEEAMMDRAVQPPPPDGQDGLMLLHGSLSGILVPAVSAAPLAPGLRGMRDKLDPYMVTYVQEAKDRGFPVVRPLVLQFPRDPKAAGETGAYMLGDEILVARERNVYLPMGSWTDFDSNRVYEGRAAALLDAPPRFLVKSGSVLPLEEAPGGRRMSLHYFPNNGGEFFIWEPDLANISQVHAAPAGDFMRVEIESLVDREYEWVIHHARRPTAVRMDDVALIESPGGIEWRSGTWYFDRSKGNLHVRLFCVAGQDVIVNITMEGSGA